MKSVFVSAAALAALAVTPALAAEPTDQLNSISERLVDLNLKFDPTIAYFTGPAGAEPPSAGPTTAWPTSAPSSAPPTSSTPSSTASTPRR